MSNVTVTTWCPTSHAEVTLTVKCARRDPFMGDIIKGKPTGCSLLGSACKGPGGAGRFCWLSAAQITTRR